eukprot:3388418-Rhodomonas_salina.1
MRGTEAYPLRCMRGTEAYLLRCMRGTEAAYGATRALRTPSLPCTATPYTLSLGTFQPLLSRQGKERENKGKETLNEGKD